jgi:hypothetical protein
MISHRAQPPRGSDTRRELPSASLCSFPRCPRLHLVLHPLLAVGNDVDVALVPSQTTKQTNCRLYQHPTAPPRPPPPPRRGTLHRLGQRFATLADPTQADPLLQAPRVRCRRMADSFRRLHPSGKRPHLGQALRPRLLGRLQARRVPLHCTRPSAGSPCLRGFAIDGVGFGIPTE